MSDGGQFHHQQGWAMARGEGAAADAQVARGGMGPRRVVLGFVLVAALVAFVFWTFLRGGATYAEVTAATVDPAAEQVTVAFTPPDDGCWQVTDDSSATVLSGVLEVDLRVASADTDCATSHTFALPLGTDGLAADATVDQVGCATPDLTCGDPVEITVGN